MKKKNFFPFLRIGVTLAILFALFKLVPYGKLIEVYKDSHKIYLFWAFLAFFLCYLIGAARWKFLLVSLGIKAGKREVFYSFFSSLFFNLFFPSFVAGDLFRGYSISRRHGELKKVASSILMDRFSGALALTLIAFFSFIFKGDIIEVGGAGSALFILCFLALFGSLAIFSKTFFSLLMKVFKKKSSLKEKISSFHNQLYFFKKNPKVFFKSFLFSFPIQIFSSIGFFISSKAFGLQIDIIYFLILVPIVMAIALIPITIAGVGTREASAVYFFSLIGVEKSVGLGMSLLNLVFLIVMGILGGIFYVSVYHRWFQPRS
ncbi:MAG: lysylphosphatidylglycerol synthase transmembrane domain-containing protein [Candidatus Omnitrophota bacterium]